MSGIIDAGFWFLIGGGFVMGWLARSEISRVRARDRDDAEMARERLRHPSTAVLDMRVDGGGRGEMWEDS